VKVRFAGILWSVGYMDGSLMLGVGSA